MKISHSFSPLLPAEISRMHRAMVIAAVLFLAVTAEATGSYRSAIVEPTPTASATASAQCQYLVRPSTQSVAAQGGSASITVLTADNCSWTATSNAPWIQVTSSGSGSVLSQGRVNYSVLPNTDTTQRVGTLTIAGATVTITQAGSAASSCVVTAINTSQSINGALTPSDCQSSLRIIDGSRPRADRYSFDATAGQAVVIALDSATIDTYLYLLDANGSVIAENDDSRAGGSRIPATGGFYVLPASGRFLIEVTTFSSGQEGNYALSLTPASGGCSYAINPSGQASPAGGEMGSVNVSTQAGCSWGSVSNNGWLTIPPGITSGPRTVNYTVAANSGLARTGSLTIAGVNFIVTQAGTNGTACPSGLLINPPNDTPGSVITITGSNLTGVTGVKFANNVAASFNVSGDTQITSTVPGGAVSGPLTITKPTCADAQTPNFAVNGLVVGVSAASYKRESLAPESIVAAFGTGLATGQAFAATVPLPTILVGTTVKVRDSAGTERLAGLFYVSASQINFVIPGGTKDGEATLTVTSGGVEVATGTLNITTVAPGLFSANATGEGLASGNLIRVKPNGDQIAEPLVVFDQASGQYVATPIDLGPEGDQVFLILYGTGWRFRSSLFATSVSIGGAGAPVSYAGDQQSFVGLDQSNVLLPRTLSGRGDVDVVMTVNGKVSNKVRIRIK